MFTPLFRVVVILLLIFLTGVMILAQYWPGAAMAAGCALFCVIGAIREIWNVTETNETDQ